METIHLSCVSKTDFRRFWILSASIANRSLVVEGRQPAGTYGLSMLEEDPGSD